MEPKQPFTYDIFLLMSSIRDRPVIWDKASDSHKNKSLRRAAWHEVCAALDPNFDQMSDEKKSRMHSLMLSKWANIRDAFLRSLKLAPQGHRPYIYYDQMKFILKECSIEEEPPDLEPTETYEDPLSTKSEDLPRWLRRRKLLKRKRTSERRANRIEIEEETSSSQSVAIGSVDEDMAFFQSLLTPVKNLSMAEKMEFRIGVLTMLQHFSRKEEEVVEEVDDEQYFGKEEI